CGKYLLATTSHPGKCHLPNASLHLVVSWWQSPAGNLDGQCWAHQRNAHGWWHVHLLWQDCKHHREVRSPTVFRDGNAGAQSLHKFGELPGAESSDHRDL